MKFEVFEVMNLHRFIMGLTWPVVGKGRTTMWRFKQGGASMEICAQRKELGFKFVVMMKDGPTYIENAEF